MLIRGDTLRRGMLIIVKELFTLIGESFLKKSCLFVLFVILAGFSVNAEDTAGEVGDGNGHFFSFGFSLGMLSGASEEIVYRNTSDDNKLSQLSWQINPLFYAGADVGYGWRSPVKPKNVFQHIFTGFFIDAFFKYGLPAYIGLMEDWDWIRQPSWVLSHYSLHDNKTEMAMLAGLDIGKSFRLYNQFRLSVFFSYDVMYYSFSASGGVFLYPESDGGHYYDPNLDNVVTYIQFWQILSPGLSLYGAFNNYFSIDIFFKISPLVTVSSFDDHLLGTMQIINDPMPFGLYIEPGFVFTFKPPDSRFLLSFSLNYRNIGGNRGDSRYKYLDNSSIYRNVGGANYSAFDIGITAGFKFGG
jgi:outer membrane protease